MDQLSFLRRTLLESAQNFTLETIIKPYGPKKVIKIRRDRRLQGIWGRFSIVLFKILKILNWNLIMIKTEVKSKFSEYEGLLFSVLTLSSWLNMIQCWKKLWFDFVFSCAICITSYVPHCFCWIKLNIMVIFVIE